MAEALVGAVRGIETSTAKTGAAAQKVQAMKTKLHIVAVVLVLH